VLLNPDRHPKGTFEVDDDGVRLVMPPFNNEPGRWLFQSHRLTCPQFAKNKKQRQLLLPVETYSDIAPNTYYSIDEIAGALRLTPCALRARCGRKARKVGYGKRKEIIADLGDGIVAVKLGRSWRVRKVDFAKAG